MEAYNARRKELIEASKALHPDLPDWWVELCVDAYISKEEREIIPPELIEEKTSNEAGQDDGPAHTQQ